MFDKKNQKELIAENALPYFEFQINKETVLSSMPVWEFIKYEERSLANQGLEYIFYFKGKGSLQRLENGNCYRQYFQNSTLTREKIQLKSTKGHNFQLNKKEGKLHFIYPRLSLNNNMKGSITGNTNS